MGLYNDKKDYQTIITENIYMAKLLNGLNKEDSNIILKLLQEKEVIIQENKLFANLKLKHLDKKINKIKNNSLKPNYNKDKIKNNSTNNNNNNNNIKK